MTRFSTFSRQKFTELLHCGICTFLIVLVSACSDAHYSYTESETGSIAFSVEWRDAPTIQHTASVTQQAAPLDCEAAGVATVTFDVYDENNSYLVGDSWPCSYHQGTVGGVPAGSDRKLVVLGEDSGGNVLYRGEATGITVTAGQTTDVGDVVVEPIYTTFSEDFDDGDFTSNPTWTEMNNDDCPGIVEVTDGSLHFFRDCPGGNGGNVRIEIETDIEVTDTTQLTFDGNPVYRDVGDGCGWSCGEFPVNVELYLEDAVGQELIVRYALNYGAAIQNKYEATWKQICASVPQNQWSTMSYMIRDQDDGWPTAVKITKIYLMASGWDFEGYIDNISICDSNNGGLVAYYPFNGNANDESGNGNHGTVNGATLTTDRFGNPDSAYSFDGVNDYISVDDATILNLEDSFSISAWIKPATVTPSISTHFTILDKGDSTIRNYALWISSDSVGKFEIDGIGNIEGNTIFVVGQWYNVVGIYNGSAMKLYINGVLGGEEAFTGNPRTSSLDLWIGNGVSAWSKYFDGVIDDLRIYNRALLPSEIQQPYNGYHQSAIPWISLLLLQDDQDCTKVLVA